MKPFARRLLLAWVIMAIPLHGFAAVAIQLCAGAHLGAMSQGSTEKAAMHAAAPESPCAHHGSIDAGIDAGESPALAGCALYAACASATTIAASRQHAAPTGVVTTVKYLPTVTPDPAFLTGGLDRPPRSSLV